MSFCPKCRTQWDDEKKTCPDCGSILWGVITNEDEIEEAETVEEQDSVTNPYEPVFLTQSTDERELKMIEKLLQAEKIPFYTRDLESGEYMRIYMGFSVYGKQIYVRARDHRVCVQMLSRLMGEYGDDEMEAAYDEYMQSMDEGEIPQADAEQEGGNHRMLGGFFVFFAVLIVALFVIMRLVK